MFMSRRDELVCCVTLLVGSGKHNFCQRYSRDVCNNGALIFWYLITVDLVVRNGFKSELLRCGKGNYEGAGY